MLDLSLDMLTIKCAGGNMGAEAFAMVRTAALIYLSRGWKRASARFAHREAPHAFQGVLYHKGEGTFLDRSGTLFVADVLVDGHEGQIHFLVIAGAEKRIHPDLFGETFLALMSENDPIDTPPSRPSFIKIPMEGFEVEKNTVN